MKKYRYLFISLGSAALLALGSLTTLAHGQDRGTAKATIGKANVTVEYGRPLLQGRDMLAKMQTGSVWRIGANEPTTITSDADLDFGGTRLAKGKHILLARLAEGGKWSLIASTKSAFQFEESAKLAEIPLEFKQAKDSVEQLTLTLSSQGEKGVLEIAWGTSRLVASFACAK